MREPWWESPAAFINDYWWTLMIILILGLTAYFTRGYWLPDPGPTLGTGDVQVTLRWENTNDLDLWVYDPNGELLYYRSPTSSSGGQLDVDANPECTDLTDRPMENVFWATGGAPLGEYRIVVQYFQICEPESSTSYSIRLLVDGEVQEFQNTISIEKEEQLITTFIR